MSELNPRARAVVTRARGVPRSTQDDRDRVRALLAARLAAPTAEGDAGGTASPSAGTSSAGSWSAGSPSVGSPTAGSPSVGPPPNLSNAPIAAPVVGSLARWLAAGAAGTLLAGAFLVAETDLQGTPTLARTGAAASIESTLDARPAARLVEAPPSAPTALAVPAKPVAPAPRLDPVSVAVPGRVESSKAHSSIVEPVPDVPVPSEPVPSPPLPSSVESLAAELAAVRRANAALASGEAAAALADLDDVARSHPSGSLVEERLALRALALCAAGRDEEARQAAEALFALAPNGPHVDRVRASCAGRR